MQTITSKVGGSLREKLVRNFATHKAEPEVTPSLRPDGEYDVPAFQKCTDPNRYFTTQYMEKPMDIFSRRAFHEPPVRNHEIFFWDRLALGVRHIIRTSIVGVVGFTLLDTAGKYGGGKGFFMRKGDQIEL